MQNFHSSVQLQVDHLELFISNVRLLPSPFKSLTNECSGHAGTGPTSYRFNAPAMGVPLRSLMKSQGNLKIDIYRSNNYMEQVTAAALNNIGSLEAYFHLKRLTINLHPLIGPELARPAARLVDVLPFSLEVLYVLDFGGEHLKHHCEQIDELVEHKERLQLRLKKIKLGMDHWQCTQNAWCESWFLKLFEARRAAGVELSTR